MLMGLRFLWSADFKTRFLWIIQVNSRYIESLNRNEKDRRVRTKETASQEGLDSVQPRTKMEEEAPRQGLQGMDDL